MKSLDNFLADLETKGFILNEEAIGFIYFGRKFTGATDTNVQVSIEVTLMLQQRFDSSFYMSVLEELVSVNLSTRSKMFDHFRKKGIAI